VLFDVERSSEDFVYFGTDSCIMADVLAGLRPAQEVARSIDLCTGSGVEGLMSSMMASETVCVDISPRATRFVCANALLNDRASVRTVVGDRFQMIAGRFDIITANTPYVPMPQQAVTPDLPLRGGALGIEFTLELLQDLPARLADDGFAVIYSSDPYVNGKPQLLSHLNDTIGRVGFDIEEILLARSYPDEPAMQTHFRKYDLTGYDDCLLVIRRAPAYKVRRRVLRPLHYRWSVSRAAEAHRRSSR